MHPGTSAVLICHLIGGLLVLPAGRTLDAQGRLTIGETYTIASDSLGEVRRINVYRPAVADSLALPVLYMPDGGIAEDFLHVAGLVQVLTGNGTMRPFLLVGIENTERRRDLTGPTSVESDRRIARRVGSSARFRAFIRHELMPSVRARYRTTNETAIVGESLAGLFVIETLRDDPSLFRTYIAFDPSLWWNGGALVTRPMQQSPSHAVKVYLATSSEPDMANAAAALAAALKGAPSTSVTYVPMPEEAHATIYHPAALRAFRFLFAPNPVAAN